MIDPRSDREELLTLSVRAQTIQLCATRWFQSFCSLNRPSNIVGRAIIITLLVIVAHLGSSCNGSGGTGESVDSGPPEEVILSACKTQAGKRWGGGGISNIVRGKIMVSDESAGGGTKIYPVRAVYKVTVEGPYLWDPVTGLPRAQVAVASALGEFRFYKNEFNEWLNEHIKTEQMETPVFSDDPRNAQFRGNLHKAFQQADVPQLEKLLSESRLADQMNGVEKSYETEIREYWFESAKEIQKRERRTESP